MAHKVDSMMYVGERPWHGLGVALDHPATAAEALVAAGLDWEVALEPAFDTRGNRIPGACALVRTDRREALGAVGTGYRPVQNRQGFAFMDHLVGDGKAIYETAGALDRGRDVWMLARVPGDIWVTKEDNVEKFLLLHNPHRQGRSVGVLFTPVRVVCANTLRSALGEGMKCSVRIRHAGDIESQIEEARSLLGISLKYFDAFEEEAHAFARRAVTREALVRYFEALIPDPKDADPSRARATRETLVRLFESGKGNDLPSVRGSVWAAVNAVAEYVDHERPTRAGRGIASPLKRFQSAQFGSGADLRARAWQEAVKLIS